MIRVLVLGHNGFVAKHLVEYLSKKEGIQLSVLGRSLNVDLGNDIRQIEGDYTDTVLLRNALENQDIVYHLISSTIPASSWAKPKSEIDENLFPFINFLEIAKDINVKKICFMSSGGTVYGLQENLVSESSPTAPFSPYGIIKNTMEHFLYYYKTKYNLNYSIFRLSNVYGYGQDIGKGLGFINTSLQNIILKKPILVFGDGTNVRDYIFVKDVAKLLFIGIEEGLDRSSLYNVGSNQSLSLKDLLVIFKEITQIDFQINYQEKRSSDVQKVVLDNSKIIKFFPKFTFTPLKEGVKNTYNHLMKIIND